MPSGCRLGETASVWGTKARPSILAQASAALLSFHNAMSCSVITITEFAGSRRQRPVQGFRKELRQRNSPRSAAHGVATVEITANSAPEDIR